MEYVTPAAYGIAGMAGPWLVNRVRIASVLPLIAYAKFGETKRVAELAEIREQVLDPNIKRARTKRMNGTELGPEVRERIDVTEQAMLQAARVNSTSQAALDAISRDFQRVRDALPNCQTCHRARVCSDDYDYDREEVNREPECLRLLRDCFQICISATQCVYERYAKWCHAKVQVTASFRECIEGLDGLEAETVHDIPTNGIDQRAHVKVEFPVCSFGADSYVALWWTCLHELGVHAVQELHLDEQPSRAGSCGFTEGLVDRALGRAFQQMYCTENAPQPLPAILDDLNEFLSNVDERRYSGTHGLRRPPRTKDAQDRLERQRAGYRVFDRLDTLLKSVDNVATLVLSLNLELSAARSSRTAPTERERFMERIAWLTDPFAHRPRVYQDRLQAREEEYRNALFHFAKRSSSVGRRGPTALLDPTLAALLQPLELQSKSLSEPALPLPA